MKNTKTNVKEIAVVAIYVILIVAVLVALFLSTHPKETKQISALLSSEGQEVLSSEPGATPTPTPTGTAPIPRNNITKTGRVIVRYVDNNGVEIKTADTQEGLVGSEYSTQRAEIEGYIAQGKDPMNKIGLYEEEDTTVVYTYMKVIENVEINNVNNTVTVKVGNVRQASEYPLRINVEDLNGNKLDNVTIKVTNESNETLKQTASINGKILAGSIVIKEEGTEILNIEQVSTIRGYKQLFNDKLNLTVTKTWNETDTAYEAEFTYNDVDGASVTVLENEVLVTITLEKIDLYNISMKKYVTSVNGTHIEGREPSVLSIDDDDYENRIVTYSVPEGEVRAKNGQSIIYNIRVYNEGNTQVLVGEITDNIPEELVFDSESTINETYGWKMYKLNGSDLVETTNEEEATIIKTNYLSTRPINGFENKEDDISSEEIQVEFKTTTQSSREDRTVTNTAKVQKLANETNETDNQDTETIILDKVSNNNIVLKKFVTQLDKQEVLGTEPTVSVVEGEVVYDRPNDVVEVENDQEIVFTLRVYNESEATIQGEQVITEIPEFMEFIADSEINSEFGWEPCTIGADGEVYTTYDMSRVTAVKTDYLKAKVLTAYDKSSGAIPDFEELKLELKVTDEKIDEDTEVDQSAVIKEVEDETNSDDNVDTGRLKIAKSKVRALGFQKFINTVDGVQIEGREPVVAITSGGKITYTKTGEVVKVKNNQQVEFILRMYNEGNVDMQGQEIIDNIPEGLIYDKNNSTNIAYGWKMYERDGEGNLVETTDETKAVVVKTNYFESQTIEPIDGTEVKYKDAKLVLNVTSEKVEEEKIIVNTAKMPNYVPGPYAPNPDPEDPEEPIIIEESEVKALSIQKFVSVLDGEVVSGREPTVTVENGLVSYSKTGEIVKTQNKQAVEFTIRLYNVGNVETEGIEILDEIPEGLVFDKTNATNQRYGWTMYKKDGTGNLVETTDETEAVAVKTNYLEDTTISKLEGNTVSSADVKLVLKVTDEKVEESIEVINKAKMSDYVAGPFEPAGNPINSEEPVIIEKTEIKALGFKKFVSKVDDTEIEGRAPVTSVDANGKVTYTKTGDIVRVKNNQVVEFTLRMYNEGNVASNGLAIVDNIPEGLFFDTTSEINNTYGWVMYARNEEGNLEVTEDSSKAVAVKTNYFESQTINPIDGSTVDFADVKLVLKVTDKKIKQDTQVVNTATMPTYVPGPYAPDPDPEDPEEPIIIEQTEVKALGFKKFVSRVDNTAITGRAPVVTVDSEGKVTYTKTGDIVKVKNNQKVEFTLRMYNTGNVASEGQEVIDNIPEGLIYDKTSAINQTYGWVMYERDEEGNLVETDDETKAVAVKTNYFVSKTINPIDGTTVKYEDAKLILKVTDKKILADTQIVNTAKMPDYVPGPYDPDPDPEDPEEPIIIEKTEVDALGFKKFVSRVDDTLIEGRAPVVTADNEGNVTYVKTGDIVRVENNQEVEFTLRMYNTGNIETNGQEIIDNIPEGLIFDKNNEINIAYGWKMYTRNSLGSLVETTDETKAVAVKTSYFEDITIAPIEGTVVSYEDAKLVLKVTSDKIEEDKEIVNTAKMPDYVPGPYDPDPDPEDPEEPIIIEKTKIKDVGMAKFVSKVDDEEITGRAPVTSVDGSGKVTYRKTGDIVRVKNNQVVEFTLRMYNEGNIPAEGHEVIDNIPEGLIYDKNNEINIAYGWKMYARNEEGYLVETDDETKAVAVKTTYFETQTIDPIEGDVVNFADAKLILKVTSEKVKEETRIVNTAKMPNYVPGPYAPNPNPEDPEEPLIIEKTEVKALGFKKFVSRVDAEAIEGREPVVEVDGEGNITYTKTGDIVKVHNKQQVEFTLRMYNEGNVDSKGQEIIDNIPEGLIFDKLNTINQTYRWVMYERDEEGNLVETDDETKAVAVKTNYLENKTIRAVRGDTVSYADVKLVLKVTEEKVEEDTQIVNTAKMPNYVPGPYDPSPDDKDPEEPLIIEKTKVEALGFKKFVSKVDDNIITGRAPVVTISDDGKITYTKPGDVVRVENNQKVEFTLRMYNEGNVNINGQEITDNIPEGLIYDKNNEINIAYGWRMYTSDGEGNLVETDDETEAVAVKTSYFEDIEIDAIDGKTISYEDVKLVLKVTEERIQKDTEIVNTAKMPNYIPGPYDPTPDDKDPEEPLIIEKTKIKSVAMKKFVSKLDGVSITGREPVVTVTDVGNVQYEKTGDIVKVENNQEVEFTLRMYNEGNVKANGTTIIDNIPTGLIFDKENEINKEYGWKMYTRDEEGHYIETLDASKAIFVKTDYLQSKTIDELDENNISYEDVKLVLTVTEDKIEEDTLIINTAKDIKDPTSPFDPTPDDKDPQEPLIIEKTKVKALGFAKFVSKVNETETEGREPVVTVQDDGKITFAKNGEIVKVKNKDIVEFTLRIYNEGNVDVKGQEIIDNIPEGLIFDKSNAVNKTYKWKMYAKDSEGNLVETNDVKKAVAVKTSYLTTKTIKPVNGKTVNYADVKLILTVTEDQIYTDTEIVNTAKMPNYVPDPYDPSPDDEEPEEKLIIEESEVKALGFKKFVSKVDERNINGRAPIVTVDDKGKIKYEKVGDIVKVKNGEEVEFTLRMYNEGNVVSEGQEIIDNIPDGLTFIVDNNTNKDFGWVMYERDEEGNLVETEDSSKAVAVKTNYLEAKTINPIAGKVVSYEDVKLVLKVTEERIIEDTRIVNTAKMPNYVPGPYDPTPNDKEPEEELILERTEIKSLGMKKFVSKVDEIATEGREPVVKVDSIGKVTYNKTGDVVKVSNGQKVEFTLRMYNQGNVDTNGTTIIDNIPEGLIYDRESEINKQYNWILYTRDVDGNLVETDGTAKVVAVKTRYLEDITINAIENGIVSYEDVKLILTVTEDKIEEDKLIINTAKMPNYVPGPHDPTPEDKEPDEPLVLEKTKKYDLGMNKFVSSIDSVKVEGREPIATVDADGKVSYEKTGEIVKVSNGQEVEFTLRMYNEGNMLVNGTELTDNIPEGLVFDPENEINKAYNWKMYAEDSEGNLVETDDEKKAVAVKTDYLETEEIKGIDGTKVNYKDVKLILTVTKDKIKDDKKIVNTAVAERLEEEKDEDADNNEGKEELILEKTKEYNLVLKKFASKLDNKELNREPSIRVDGSGKVSYIQDETELLVANNQVVEFTLRVYNEGNILAEGPEIIDNIPEGLVFDPENETNKAYGWKMYAEDSNGNLVSTEDARKVIAVKTDYLSDVEIDVFNDELKMPSYQDVKVVLKVDESKVSKDRFMINTARIDTPDENMDDNEGSEILRAKYFDLDITKYISRIIIEDDQGQEVHGFGINHKGQVYKADLDAKRVPYTTIYVTYTLQVENIGEIPGYATELTDIIPDGLELVEDENWKLENGKAVSTALENELLNPGEKTSIKINFVWDLSDEEVGKKENEAKITKYKNPYDAQDLTEKNSDKESIIIGIRTGLAESCIVAVFVALLISVPVIIVIRRKAQKK